MYSPLQVDAEATGRKECVSYIVANQSYDHQGKSIMKT
jgi:hypothetical protein